MTIIGVLAALMSLILAGRDTYQRMARKSRARDYIVRPPPWRESEERAGERRAFLSNFLEAPFPYRVVEAPPGLEPDRREELDEMEALGQFLRFRAYASSISLLLMDRAADLMEIFVQRGMLPPGSPYSLHLERNHPSDDHRFQWTLVIGYELKAKLEQLVAEFGGWLGIAVVIRPPVLIELQGRCQVGNGRNGTCGGSVQVSGDPLFAVTCEHVPASGCHSIVTPRRTAAARSTPDVALLRPTHCFPMDGPASAVTPMGASEIEDAVASRMKAAFAVPSPSRVGTMRHPAAGYWAEEIFWRVPCVMIEAPGVRRPLFRWLRIKQKFSEGGDSGAWIVLEADREKWVGMVVGADDTGRASCIIQANIVAGFASHWLSRPGGPAHGTLGYHAFV